MSPNNIINPHPGEILLEEFLKPMGLSQNRLSMEIRVPCHRINEIIHGRRGISADTALRLARFFGTSAEFWMNLQQQFDLTEARHHLSKELPSIRTIAEIAGQI